MLFNVSRLWPQNGQERKMRVYFSVKTNWFFGCAEGQCVCTCMEFPGTAKNHRNIDDPLHCTFDNVGKSEESWFFCLSAGKKMRRMDRRFQRMEAAPLTGRLSWEETSVPFSFWERTWGNTERRSRKKEKETLDWTGGFGLMRLILLFLSLQMSSFCSLQ